MTEKETKMILALMRQNYKNAKIDDPAAEVALWMLEFGEYPAKVIETAVRFFMSSNKKSSDFWPTTASIRKQIPRAESYLEFVENNRPRPELIDPNYKPDPKQKEREDYYLEELCKFVGLGQDPDDNADLTLDNFLPYEK